MPEGPSGIAPDAAPDAAVGAGSTAPGRLLVMAHFVHAGRVGGAEQILYNVLRGVARHGAEVSLVCGARDRLDPVALAELETLAGLRVIEAGGTGIRFAAEQRACLRADLAAEAVLFPNYYVPPVVPRRLGRVAVVLHDMQYRHFPQYFSAKKRVWLAVSQALAMRRAGTVVAISRFVAEDAVRCYGSALEGRLAVIPNPVFWDRLEGDGDTPLLDRPYILSVAAQYPHKNLDTLIRAFALLAARDSEVMLVLCGQDYGGLRGTGGARTDLRALVDELGLAGRVRMTGYVSDAELGRWYRHAALFAFPSIFEGFGVPPVEALGLGLPTLTTAATALPEVTLGLAQYVDDPYSAAEWAARMEAILRAPSQVAPGDADVRRLRAHYDVGRIGRLYLTACGL